MFVLTRPRNHRILETALDAVIGIDAKGDPLAEYLQHFRLGVDGVFSDVADTALEGRNAYLKEIGQ